MIKGEGCAGPQGSGLGRYRAWGAAGGMHYAKGASLPAVRAEGPKVPRPDSDRIGGAAPPRPTRGTRSSLGPVLVLGGKQSDVTVPLADWLRAPGSAEKQRARLASRNGQQTAASAIFNANSRVAASRCCSVSSPCYRCGTRFPPLLPVQQPEIGLAAPALARGRSYPYTRSQLATPRPYFYLFRSR